MSQTSSCGRCVTASRGGLAGPRNSLCVHVHGIWQVRPASARRLRASPIRAKSHNQEVLRLPTSAVGGVSIAPAARARGSSARQRTRSFSAADVSTCSPALVSSCEVRPEDSGADNEPKSDGGGTAKPTRLGDVARAAYSRVIAASTVLHKQVQV